MKSVWVCVSVMCLFVYLVQNLYFNWSELKVIQRIGGKSKHLTVAIGEFEVESVFVCPM